VTTEKFLDLVTMYCQVNLLWSLIADRRTIAAGFARAFNVVKSQNESNFPKVAQYLVRSSFLITVVSYAVVVAHMQLSSSSSLSTMKC
jgi:hypothetical protein